MLTVNLYWVSGLTLIHSTKAIAMSSRKPISVNGKQSRLYSKISAVAQGNHSIQPRTTEADLSGASRPRDTQQDDKKFITYLSAIGDS